MGTRRKIVSLILLTALSSAGAVSTAAADPIDIQRDRSDNTMYFQYNAINGQIPSAYSSRIIRRKDRVDFFSYVAEREGARQGRRLRGRIVLRLNLDRPVRYHGRFSLVVQNDVGVAAFRGVRDVDLVLRPREGRRFRVLRWTFDLPSGDYTVYARFKSV